MQIRQATKDDLGFVYETFLRSFRAASTHAEGLDNATVVKLLSNLLSKGWRADVAESENYIAGWIVTDQSVPFDVRNAVAWIYVRDMFRGQGVGRKLINWTNVDTNQKIITPFLPNRQPKRWRFIHRPFEVVA